MFHSDCIITYVWTLTLSRYCCIILSDTETIAILYYWLLTDLHLLQWSLNRYMLSQMTFVNYLTSVTSNYTFCVIFTGSLVGMAYDHTIYYFEHYSTFTRIQNSEKYTCLSDISRWIRSWTFRFGLLWIDLAHKSSLIIYL